MSAFFIRVKLKYSITEVSNEKGMNMEKQIDGTCFGTVTIKIANNITGTYEICPTKMQKLATSIPKASEEQALRMPLSITLPF